MSLTENPNVAALILRGGGHIGYFPYNKAYTYSLIVNFFDPERGAAACRKGTSLTQKPSQSPIRNPQSEIRVGTDRTRARRSAWHAGPIDEPWIIDPMSMRTSADQRVGRVHDPAYSNRG